MALSENNIDKLKQSITRLITRSKELEKENNELRARCKSMTSELEKSQSKVTELEGQLTASLLGRGLTEVAGGVKGAKTRINTLIRDIDRCISILNR